MGNDVLEPLFCLFTAGIFLPVLGDRLMLVILVVMNPRNHRAVLTLGFLHFQCSRKLNLCPSGSFWPEPLLVGMAGATLNGSKGNAGS